MRERPVHNRFTESIIEEFFPELIDWEYETYSEDDYLRDRKELMEIIPQIAAMIPVCVPETDESPVSHEHDDQDNHA